MRTKTKYEKIEAPSISAKKLLADNWFLIKTVFKAAPGAMSLYAFEQFRVSFMIFFEHTYLIKTVLDCARDGRPFGEALMPILIVAGILILTSVLGSITGQWLQPKAELAAVTALKNKIFEKAKEVDLKNFDDPDYYNDFNLAIEQVPSLVSYIIQDVITVAASALGTFVTTGVYFAVESAPVFFLVFAASVGTLFLGIISSKMRYGRRAAAKKYERKIAYIKRLFYLSAMRRRSD